MATFGVIHRKRFHPQDDLDLMREVLSANPFIDSTKWTVVAHGVNAASGKEFTARGCRERIDLLLNLFRKQDWPNLKKSGSEDQYKEKTALLQQVSDLDIECGGPRTRVTNSARRPAIQPKPKDSPSPMTVTVVADTSEMDSSLLCQIHEEGVEASPEPSYAYSEHEEAPITGDVELVLSPDATQFRKWPPKHDYGKRKADNINGEDTAVKKPTTDVFIREKELELEERRLRLEEEKLALEKTKFEADREYEMRKLEMEEEDRRSRRESERLQAELMRKMFDHLVKKIA